MSRTDSSYRSLSRGSACFGGAPAFAGDMSFFVSSAGSGKGADLGGLEGADRICRTLAEAAGAGGRTWRAYLSTQGAGAVNARDRIGAGPWVNAKGVVVAKNPAELHGANNLTKQTALNEKGAGRQRSRGHPEHARHPHRIEARRHGIRR